MKNIIIILLCIFSLAIVLNKKNTNNIEVVITVPNLTEKDLSYNLKNEFQKYSDISYIDGSSASNTIVLQVRENDFNQKQVETLLNKWGYDVAIFDFNNLSASLDVE